MILNKPKLLYLANKSGCAYWRLYLPSQYMQKNGLAEVRFIDLRETTYRDLGADLKWCDMVVTTGLMGTTELAMLRQYQNMGLKVAIDYDDLYFNVSPFNTAYRNIGTEEVQVKDPTTGDIQYLWKDGKNGFDLKANQVKFHAYKAILAEADLITTTTLYLKNAMVDVGGREDNISVIPNAIDFTQWKPMDVREKLPGKFRFGWAVSASHGEDWLFIRPVIVDFLRKHPDAIFVIIGDTHIDIKKAYPDLAPQIEWYPFSDLWEGHYPMRMAMLGLDVGICPLADLEFNRCKSPLKWEEYTAFGWPTVAQNMEPYSSHIVTGETGLLASTHEEWMNALEAFYSNPSLRSKLAFNAKFAVRELFDLEKVAREWADVYSNLITGSKNEFIEHIK